MSQSCKFVETGRLCYWGLGLVDPSEPEFVAGKGVPLPLDNLPCRNLADAGEDYCPKHKMQVERTGS
jgi:hypothetical protein